MGPPLSGDLLIIGYRPSRACRLSIPKPSPRRHARMRGPHHPCALVAHGSSAPLLFADWTMNRPRFYAHFLCWKDGAMSIRYDENTKARAVRLVREHRDDYESEWAAMKAISGRLGMNPETLRKW